MLNIISTGLNANSLTAEALDAIKTSDKVYLENYTVDFPYSLEQLEKTISKKITPLAREQVESEKIVEQAKNQNISLLIYGDALSATTHIQLLLAAKKQKIKYKVFHNASILTAIAETGLQIYKFGKTASMPKFRKNYKPKSFVDIIKDNLKIKAHTLLLIDIGLPIGEALEQLEKTNLKLDKLIICSQLGVDSKIFYDKIEKLKIQNTTAPFCIIIPSDLHFTEQEFLETLK